MDHLYVWLCIPVILLTAWLYTASVAQSRFPVLRDKAIILLIAHPDDEAMFFSPTILGLTRPELGNHLKILCLSSGNADNLGSTRKKEIITSARILGLRADTDVHVIEDPSFVDSMHEHWDAVKIAELLDSFFVKGSGPGKRKNAREETSSGRPAETTINVLITFDEDGVSGHPNHRSLHAGATYWLQTMMKGRKGWDAPVKLYRLASTNTIRKYASLLDMPFTLIKVVLDSLSSSGKRSKKEFPSQLLFLNDFSSYRKAQRAMTEAHKTQMVWFRWGWITLSRYMVVNDLKKVEIRS